MGKLSANARKKLPKKDFAGPDGSYPIEDENHARDALSRVSQYGNPELKKRVRAKVHNKFPTIGKKQPQKDGLRKFAQDAAKGMI